MVVYDLGANVGFYTLLFSRLVARQGVVHAFEPLDRNLQLLNRHVALNGCTNVRIHPVAVGQTTRSAAFDPTAGPSMARVVDNFTPSTITVSMVSLDDFVYMDGHEPPDVVKIDIEGGEADALAGMRRVLADKRPMLLTAVHGRDRWRDCYQILADAGYTVCDLMGRRLDPATTEEEIIATVEN
jgi:FkbM family methyltransferase